MSEEVDTPIVEVAERYRQALRDYMFKGCEEALHEAYEIGRQAVGSNFGILGLVDVHTHALAELLGETRPGEPDGLRSLLGAAGRFLSESLSPFEMLHVRDEETNAALRRMNEMLEQEAKRVAHTLHDQAGTLLATIYLDLAEIARDLPQPTVDRINRINAHLDQVREQLRGLSHEVHPPILDELGLLPALQFLADGIAERTGLAITIEGSAPRDCPQAVNTTVYRVVQEALANVMRHSGATRASVRMWSQGGLLHCLIRDDGRGFDVSRGRSRKGRGGLGLIGMEERIRTLGGEIQVTSVRGQGTTVRFSLPRKHLQG